jgi:hypothetical protein
LIEPRQRFCNSGGIRRIKLERLTANELSTIQAAE